VLEIGTGAGYNAAILANHVGADHVTTIEFDPALADTARSALAAYGYRAPRVQTGDGAEGHAACAPYDRLIATCGFPEIPRAWHEQVRPGGLIVANLYRPLGTGLLAVLRVQRDGTALGKVAGDSAGFMPARAIRTVDPVARHRAAWRSLSDAATRLSPLAIDVLDDAGFRFHAGLSVPAADLEVLGEDSSTAERWLFAGDGSTARARPAEGGTSVAEEGPVALWAALEDAHDTYQQLGRPGRGTYRIAVTDQGQYAWHPSQRGKHWPLRCAGTGRSSEPGDN
jgi:protein-L-isoaspartate O-methyltransferase